MRLMDVLSESLIIPELKAKDKKDVLQELTATLVEREDGLDHERLVSVLMDREKLGSTGIGEGVAIPHGKLHEIDHPFAVFGRSKHGVDFQSMDGRPAHLFFLLFAPENSTGIHLKALARISRLLKSASNRKRLLDANSRAEIFKIIVEEDKVE